MSKTKPIDWTVVTATIQACIMAAVIVLVVFVMLTLGGCSTSSSHGVKNPCFMYKGDAIFVVVEVKTDYLIRFKDKREAWVTVSKYRCEEN